MSNTEAQIRFVQEQVAQSQAFIGKLEQALNRPIYATNNCVVMVEGFYGTWTVGSDNTLQDFQLGGILNATRTSRGIAKQIAPNVKNGNGVVGVVMGYRDALRECIAGQEELIEQFENWEF
jgi:hypothetical protein